MNEKDDKFVFSFNLPPKGENLKAFTSQETEDWLKKELEESGGNDVHILNQMFDFYSTINNYEQAISCAQRLLAISENTEEEISILVRLGVLGERVQNYSFAESCYRNALKLGIPANEKGYWVYNNLGYCLNMLGRHSEAEQFLKQAITLCPEYYNAYKNLGICHQGLGRYIDAVEQFIVSTHKNAADCRSLGHLESLIAEHPELYDKIPGLESKIKICMDAVAHAKSMIPDFDGFWRNLRSKQDQEREDQT